MRCEICGTTLDDPVPAHDCRSELADTYALASRRVVRFGVLYAVVVAVVGALGFAGYTAIGSGAADPTAVSTQASVLLFGAITGLVGLVCVVVLLISTVVWIVSVHRITRSGPGVVGYNCLSLCVLLIALAYVVPRRVPTLGGAVATEAAMRIGGVVALIAGVLLVRSRIRRRTGQTSLAGRPRLITSDDWGASKWDPEVMRDIERRRGTATGQAD
jgi:drug/metabolite transporter (DMT)-like permease